VTQQDEGERVEFSQSDADREKASACRSTSPPTGSGSSSLPGRTGRPASAVGGAAEYLLQPAALFTLMCDARALVDSEPLWVSDPPGARSCNRPHRPRRCGHRGLNPTG
jgi:hypothetical protein